MRDLVKKRITFGKVILILIGADIILGAIVVLMELFIQAEPKIETGIFMTIPSYFLIILYLGVSHNCRRSVKDLRERGIDYKSIIRDIDFSKPILPKSKIYMGQMAMYLKKTGILLDYESIVWIYVRVTKAYGVITTSEEFVVNTITGRNYNIVVNEEEFVGMLKECAHMFSPYFMIGYTSENCGRYNYLIKSYKRQIQ